MKLYRMLAVVLPWLTARHAHVTADRRDVVASIDDEVMALGFAADGFMDGLCEDVIVFAGP